jgi:hypothetical protein
MLHTHFVALTAGSFDHEELLVVHPVAYGELESPVMRFTLNGATANMRAHGVLLSQDVVIVDLFGDWMDTSFVSYGTDPDPFHEERRFAGLLIIGPKTTGIMLAWDDDNELTGDLDFMDLIPHLREHLNWP